MPKNSPARAVSVIAAISSFGMAWVLLIRSTEVNFPFSISRYPVGITSRLKAFNFEAALTCWPIKYSGFRPDIKDKNKIPSASSVICETSPGNSSTGKVVCLLISRTRISVQPGLTVLPPTKICVLALQK